MANPLFYNQVTPLNSEEHRNLRLKPAGKPFGFAREANLVPALIEEFSASVTQMPVAFLPGAKHPSAVFVTGVAPGKNLFISDEGHWTGNYVPAYLRRYPFIMGDVPNADPVLCIDTSFEGLNAKDGARLFNKAGEIEEPVQQALGLAENYRISAQRTEAFCARLQELELFRTVTLDAKLDNGQSTVVHGLMIVDEGALEALSSDVLAGLAKDGFLKPIYAHLLSLPSLEGLAQRARGGKDAAAA